MSKVVNQAYEVGRETSKIAEAVQNDFNLLYAKILLGEVKPHEVKKTYDQMQKETMELFEIALTGFERVLKDIEPNTKRLFNNSLKGANRLYKIDRDDRIYNSLKKITANDMLANMKVTYKNGRRIGFKEYIEMATRTRIQHELIDQTKELGVITKQLFYVCNTFSDCANDHLDYQGKLYYDEEVWKSIPRSNPYWKELKKGVDRCMMSVDKVTTGKPYLLTRPNCRHRMIPIAIDDVLMLPVKDILKKNKADSGNYSKSQTRKNFKDGQTQRRYELNIRTNKRNLDIYEMAYKQTGDEKYLKEISRVKFNVRKNQKAIRNLLSKNSTLKRDYRRENPYTLQRDLGVRYNEGAKELDDSTYKLDEKYLEED